LLQRALAAVAAELVVAVVLVLAAAVAFREEQDPELVARAVRLAVAVD